MGGRSSFIRSGVKAHEITRAPLCPVKRLENRVKWVDFLYGGNCLNVKHVIKSYLFLVLIAGLIILIDQLSKAYVRVAFGGPDGLQMWAPWDWMLPYARIIHVTNTGVAFGMFQGLGKIFAILALGVALAIIYYFPRVPAEDWILRVSMSLMLAGALGNLIDRLTHNWQVTDFISVGNFPVFNVADSSITIGVLILVIGVWIQEKHQKDALKKPEKGPEQEGGQIGDETHLHSTLDVDTQSQDNH